MLVEFTAQDISNYLHEFCGCPMTAFSFRKLKQKQLTNMQMTRWEVLREIIDLSSAPINSHQHDNLNPPDISKLDQCVSKKKKQEKPWEKGGVKNTKDWCAVAGKKNLFG